MRSLRLCLGILAVTASIAATTPSLAELKFTTGELPSGSRFILVSGDFGPSDDLASFVNLVSSHKPDFITFDSPGGNIGTALKLGRVIRLLTLSTRQTRPFQCDSACAFAFIGGVDRRATPGSIGVHRNSLRKDIPRDPDQDSEDLQLIVGHLLSYLREMGISSELLELALKTESADMRHLTLVEMQKFGVVGGLRQAEPNAPKIPPEVQPNYRPPEHRQQTVPRNAQELHDCDRLAANRYDARKAKQAPGVEYDALLRHRKEAATQCEAAVGLFPAELRFRYQLARSLELDDPRGAAAIYSNLIKQKYIAAYDNLGWMYQTGRFGGKVNKELAAKLFREGALLGDLDSTHSLGVALWDDNPQEALRWLKQAADLGHAEAKKNLQKLQDQIRQNENIFRLNNN